VAISLPIHAAEWSAQPEVTLRTGYNDNIRLTSVDHDSVWETVLRPAVKFGVATENKGLTGNADFSIRRFTGGSGLESSDRLDREDVDLNLNAYHRMERGNSGLGVTITRDSTLDSELDDTGNVIEERATRLSQTLSPSWSRLLTERMRLDLSYRFTTVGYSDELPPLDLIGYNYDVFSASLVRMFSARINGTASYSYSRYKPEIGFDSDTLSLQAGASWNVSQTLSSSILAGLRKTTTFSTALVPTGFCVGADPGAGFPDCTGGFPVLTEYISVPNDIKNTGAVFSASLSKQLEKTSLSVSLTRSASPSGNGELLDTTSLRVSGERRFTEKLGASLSIQLTDRETITNTGTGSDTGNRRFFRITPKISWRWRHDLRLTAAYEYAENEYANNVGNPSRNAVYLALNYQRPRISLSR